MPQQTIAKGLTGTIASFGSVCLTMLADIAEPVKLIAIVGGAMISWLTVYSLLLDIKWKKRREAAINRGEFPDDRFSDRPKAFPLFRSKNSSDPITPTSEKDSV